MRPENDQLPAILLTEPVAPVPALIAARGHHAGRRFIEFFTANIRNPNTRKAYYRAACEFFDWCDEARLNLLDIEPVHVAVWVEDIGTRFKPPTVKQWLAAVRMLFDWLVVGQVLAVNPAAPVHGPKHVLKVGKTPVLGATEARQLLDSIDIKTVVGRRDRALIALLTFSFARIGAALHMNVEDVYWQHRRLWVRLHEKGSKQHCMPCHHHLESYLQDYIEHAGLAGQDRQPLFRTAVRRTKILTERRMTQSDAWRMVQRRARDAGILTAVCNHTFRATGITAYLDNGGSLEKTPRPWPRTRVRAPPSFTIALTIRSRLMRSRKSAFDPSGEMHVGPNNYHLVSNYCDRGN